MVHAQKHPEQEVKIAMVGKYTDFADSYKSLNEALIHAGIQTRSRVNIVYIDAETLEQNGVDMLADSGWYFGSWWIWPSWRRRMILAAQYARIHNIPYLGICLGYANCHH